MGVEVEGQVALVTGANRGIGKAIVEAFLQHGAIKVYAAVRDLATAQPLVAILGNKVAPLHIDLAKPNSIVAAAKTAADVQIVVNNAGVLRTASPLADDAIEALRYEIDINVFGLIRMAQAFAPVLKANGGGAFVQLNSIASLRSFADFATYAASKAAAYSITQALDRLLAAQQTAVLSVHPGPIATDMAQSAGLGEIAEPPSLVGEGIVAALKSGQFHLFPDTMAKQVGEEYASFAKNVVEGKSRKKSRRREKQNTIIASIIESIIASMVFLRFRISTLLWAAVGVGAGFVVWQRYVAERIESVFIRKGSVVVQLNNDYAGEVLAGDSPGVTFLLTESYLEFPLAQRGVLVVALAAICIVVLRTKRRKRAIQDFCGG